MPETAPVEHDWLVVLSVSTTALALTIAVRTGDDLDLKLHRRQEIRLYDLAEPARAEKLNTFISTCCEAAGLAAIHSLFLCHSEDDLQCANGRGYAEMGEDIVLQASERRMALHRATVQSLPEDRVVLATLPLRWSVMGPAGDREVDDPCGQRGSRITCDVLLIHGRETTTKWVVDCLADRGVRVESHIAAPVAAYRTLAGDFPKTNGLVVIGVRQRPRYWCIVKAAWCISRPIRLVAMMSPRPFSKSSPVRGMTRNATKRKSILITMRSRPTTRGRPGCLPTCKSVNGPWCRRPAWRTGCCRIF